jgi:signal peptide peptidase SppA
MKAAEWIATVAWCITGEALEAMVSIAERTPLGDIEPRFHTPESLAARASKPRDDTGGMRMRDGVAIITIDGPIYRYADFFTSVSGGITTAQISLDVQKALDDPSVQALLFVLDSPGGEATGINELADMIYAARGTKPLAAYIEGYGASAAYWIASSCDRISCDASALIGSIGTVMGVPDPAKQQSRSISFVSSQSPKKRADPTTVGGAAYLQTLVDSMTEVFIAKVMRNRSMTYDQVAATEGGLFVGQQAIDAGLVDSLGSEEQAISALRDKAAATRRPSYSTIRQESTPMNWKEFFGGMFEASAAIEGTPLQSAIEASAAQLRPIETQEVPDDPRIAELQKQLGEMQRQSITSKAQAFVSSLVASNRALPAESAELIAIYTQAAQDDTKDNLGRVARIEAVYQARVPHQLTEELVPGEHTALSLDRAPVNSASSVQSLMQMTTLGRRVLAKSA